MVSKNVKMNKSSSILLIINVNINVYFSFDVGTEIQQSKI